MDATAQPTATIEVVEFYSAPATETPAAAAVEQETKPGLLERISASLQTKTALLAEVATFRSRAEAAEEALATATVDLTAARERLAALEAERAQITAQLATVEAESATAELAAAKIVATIGFPAAELPAAESEPPETKEQLVAKLETEPDNNKRYALAAKINAMN